MSNYAYESLAEKIVNAREAIEDSAFCIAHPDLYSDEELVYWDWHMKKWEIILRELEAKKTTVKI